MSIDVNELIDAVRGIVEGEGNYILITKQELLETCKTYHEDQSKGLKVVPIPERPVQEKQQELVATPIEYKKIKYGEADPNDIAGDIEMDNKPIYYVPVGDGLYRPTKDRRIFLFHACLALCKAKLVNASYGNQYTHLVENGFESYDICLATKMKEADALRMIDKDNADIPYYVRSRWSMCFDAERPWHPVTIKKREETKAIEEANAKQDSQVLKQLFTTSKESTDVEQKPTTLIGKKYYAKTIVTKTNTPINFKDYSQFLNVCVRKEGSRGQGVAYPNIDAISAWLKEDVVVRKELPLDNLKRLTEWCAKYQISAKQFLAAFGRQYNAQLAFTIPLVESINGKLGVDFLVVNAKRNPRQDIAIRDFSKKITGEDITTPQQEEEYITKIRKTLWMERKYGIQTLRKLFSILESVATRQQIIDLFNIQMDELNNPTDLNKYTAIEINKFCNKAVAIGNK